MKSKHVTKLNNYIQSYIDFIDTGASGKEVYKKWGESRREFIRSMGFSLEEQFAASLAGAMTLPLNGRNQTEYARNAFKRWQFQIRDWVQR